MPTEHNDLHRPDTEAILDAISRGESPTGLDDGAEISGGPNETTLSDARFDHASASPADSQDLPYDATFVVPQPDESEHPVFVRKQERDLAFALAAIHSGALAENELTRVIDEWTIHGSETLAEFVARKGLIAEERRDEVDALAQQRLQQVLATLPDDQWGMSSGESCRIKLSMIDPRGRLTKLLGIAATGTWLLEDVPRVLFARYSLIRKLGQGGLGTVWLARDQNLQRYVAIKEINSSGQHDVTALARFRREAEITGRLEHPGIVPIYQFGWDEETRRVFYVMRFLGKQTLQDAINEYHERLESGDQNRMSIHNLLTAFVSVCQAIAHAHSRKVIHRDLKPDNVALDSFGQVVLLDWGLAKINDETGVYDGAGEIEPADIHDSGTSLAAQVVGTPSYMAPEQAAGRHEDIDERTDVYGLGAILYTILTGVAPHETTIRGSRSRLTISELLTAIVRDPTPSPRDFNPSLPRELDAICRKAMAKKRFMRYPSAVALAEDVQRWMAGEAVSAISDAPFQKLRRWSTANRRSSQSLMGVLTVAFIAIICLSMGMYRDRIIETRAVVERVHGEGREVAIGLRADIDRWTRDTRFVAGLPPVTALADKAASDSREERSPDPEQRDAFGRSVSSTFRKLFDDNGFYRSIALIRHDADLCEVLRVERGTGSGGVISDVPPGCLTRLASEAVPRVVAKLRPGQTYAMRGSLGGSETGPDQLGYSILSPVFTGESGEYFGFVVIEADLGRAAATRFEDRLRWSRQATIGDDGGDRQLTYVPARQSFLPTLTRATSSLPVEQAPTPQQDGDRSIFEIVLGLDSRNPDAAIRLQFLR
ncbi:serine/threonine-protein kinase [Stratiformator vulcanicus]|uniref:Serine/threonine-protein kinase PknD n=1 Tax=Stratiformator vulcanicus TaxID=2527980 RepID=A0A517QZB3_9PLAN|nr:serine/threonine-protein kinase [Stratiformator vulcanicus]QDT36944.1 Serine/threonine-protein kinase PknD [Stratiformator vulcanicus]